MAHCYASPSAVTGAPYAVPVEEACERRPPAYATGLRRPSDDALYAPAAAHGVHCVRREPRARRLDAHPRAVDASSVEVDYVRHLPTARGPRVSRADFAGRLVTRGEWYDDRDSTFGYRFVWQGEDPERVVPTHRLDLRYRECAQRAGLEGDQ